MHFSWRLPAVLRGFVIKILAAYFRGLPVPQSFTDKLTAQRDNLHNFCLITESSSVIIEGLINSFARRSNLQNCCNIGVNKPSSAPSCLRWCSIHEEKLLEEIILCAPQTTFSTFNIFSGRGPFKNNPSYRLGFWDLAGIIVLSKFLIIFLGKDLELPSLNIRSLSSLVRVLRLDFYKNHKVVRGTPFQSIDSQERVVIKGLDFSQELQKLAIETGIPITSLERKARKAFYEIAANPRPVMYRVIAFCADFIIKRLFSTVKINGMESLKHSVRESTVVLVPMHRSHLDYILIGSTLYKSGLNPPLVAAGINLSFWPAGSMIRSVGAYFVKRNARSDKLHALILKRYVSYLTKRGHLQEFFIEGGRSRSGKMRRPKLGLLNIFLSAYQKGYNKDILFTPVSVTYENVIEDSSYGTENAGKQKQKENFFALLKAGRIFGQSYGDVTINFGEPLSLAAFLGEKESRGVSPNGMENFAMQLTRAIRDRVNPSLTSILHTALLLSPNYGMRKKNLITCMKNLGQSLEMLKVVTPEMGEFTPSLSNFLKEKEPSLSDFQRAQTINVKNYLGEDIFYIPGSVRFTADFYKNSIIHFLLPLGIFSILDLQDLDISNGNIQTYYKLLRSDYILEDWSEFQRKCEMLRTQMTTQGILAQLEGKTRFIQRIDGVYIPSLLAPTMQGIVWAKRSLLHLSAGLDPISSSKIDYEVLMKTMLEQFRTGAYLGEMTRTESSSGACLNAALETLEDLEIIKIENEGTKSKFIHLADPSFEAVNAAQCANTAIKRWLNCQAQNEDL